MKKVYPDVTKEDVKHIVRSCTRCNSIDTSPVVHEKGELNVDENWKRLAIDVTHYRGITYLSMIDCGPSRFAIWKALSHERTENIIKQLREVFLERGPVAEILVDNGTAFKSQLFRNFRDVECAPFL